MAREIDFDEESEATPSEDQLTTTSCASKAAFSSVLANICFFFYHLKCENGVAVILLK